MVAKMYSWATLVVLLATSHNVRAARPFTDLVNMFIGTASGANGGSGGNNFPGAAIPHGMVKVGMDTDSGDNVSAIPSGRSQLRSLTSDVACWIRRQPRLLGYWLFAIA